jgi:hypothetical protein
MTRTLSFLSSLVLTGVLLAMAAGCSKDEPPVVWDPGDAGAVTPAISAVSPPSALGGITQVRISGKNFSRVDTNNVVYFGVKTGQVISSTESTIVVVPPDLDEGAYQISVVVAGAFTRAVFGAYTVQHAGIEYGGFGDLDETYSIAVDASENLFAQLRAATGDTARVFLVPPSFPFTTKSLYGTLKTAALAPWPKASDMRMGPGGYLYMQQTNNANLYRIAPGGGVTVLYTVLPAKATGIDFDQNKNLFAGGDRAGVSVVKPDGTKRIVGSYGTMTIKALKVFNGELYLATAAPGATPGVWKSAILNADGDLGPPVQVLSWVQAPGTFPASAVLALAIAADGTVYVGCDNADPILVVPTSGTPSALYPGVLSPPATQLIWGTGEYLYCNRDHSVGANRRVIRIAMGKNGAPDYGR